jgi:hypothetical protein
MTLPAIHGHQVGDQFPGHRQGCAIGVALLFFVVNMRRECRASHTNQRQRTGKDGLTLQPNLGAALCKDVTEMITKFEKEEIPHEAGHALDSNIGLFEKATNRKLLSAMALNTLSDLRKLSQEAETVDLYLYQDKQGEPRRQAWTQKARGIVGELRSEAAKLRAGH